jgi:ATP-dependent RNA helicase DHX37/DHR1
MTCTFGKRAWQIPSQELEYPPGLEKFKWFARFFLEGKVVPSLQKFVPVLLGAPSSMIKSWAKLHPRTEVLLSELVSVNADSRTRLREALEGEERFLLNAYKQWIPKSKHTELEDVWPTL